MARSYKRDKNGRFAGGGGGGSAGAGKSGKKTNGKNGASAVNKVAASPRRLNKDEKIAASVMSSSKFRSDRQRVNEMIKRGVSPSADFGALVANTRSKLGGKTTDTIKSLTKKRKS